MSHQTTGDELIMFELSSFVKVSVQSARLIKSLHKIKYDRELNLPTEVALNWCEWGTLHPWHNLEWARHTQTLRTQVNGVAKCDYNINLNLLYNIIIVVRPTISLTCLLFIGYKEAQLRVHWLIKSFHELTTTSGIQYMSASISYNTTTATEILSIEWSNVCSTSSTHHHDPWPRYALTQPKL